MGGQIVGTDFPRRGITRILVRSLIPDELIATMVRNDIYFHHEKKVVEKNDSKNVNDRQPPTVG